MCFFKTANMASPATFCTSASYTSSVTAMPSLAPLREHLVDSSLHPDCNHIAQHVAEYLIANPKLYASVQLLGRTCPAVLLLAHHLEARMARHECNKQLAI